MIFVAHEPRGAGIDLTALDDYAKSQGHAVQFVFTRGFNVGEHPHEAMAAAETFAAKFDFQHDKFGVVGGDPLAGMICMAALVHEAIAAGAKLVHSFRFVKRMRLSYLDITIPTGV